MAESILSQGSNSHDNERLEPQILRAAERDDVESLIQIITTAKAQDRLNDQLLGIALKRSSEKGKIAATKYPG